jgi:hypothetical protein
MKLSREFQKRVDREYLKEQFPFTNFKITKEMRQTMRYNEIALDMSIEDLKNKIKNIMKDAGKKIVSVFDKFI